MWQIDSSARLTVGLSLSAASVAGWTVEKSDSRQKDTMPKCPKCAKRDITPGVKPTTWGKRQYLKTLSMFQETQRGDMVCFSGYPPTHYGEGVESLAIAIHRLRVPSTYTVSITVLDPSEAFATAGQDCSIITGDFKDHHPVLSLWVKVAGRHITGVLFSIIKNSDRENQLVNKSWLPSSPFFMGESEWILTEN